MGQLVPKPNPAFLLERYSSLDKLLGVTGWIKRFVNNCRKPQAERNFTPVLSPAERNAALCSLVRVVQAEHFEEEVRLLRDGRINHLADWTEEELKSTRGLRPGKISVKVEQVNISKALPDSFDWRDKKVLNPVKDQGMCGSCWAFSTIGSVEPAYAIKHKQLISLSEQQLVDCDTTSHGCNGGLMSYALTYLKDCGGSESEADYPYETEQDTCRFAANKVKVKVVGQQAFDLGVTAAAKQALQAFDLGLTTAAKQALVSNGPISIAVDANNWNFYTGGIFPCTPGKGIDHGVVLVGYGAENGVPYWIVRNSWGAVWGEGGYIRIRMSGTNENSVCTMNAVPGVVPVIG
ncbi:papain family cysteine protease domain-containing protein [Phthorimaea operculella]|nr:papain family cysteine protease domain-containing protein [Phthorimaea operculella]